MKLMGHKPLADDFTSAFVMINQVQGVVAHPCKFQGQEKKKKKKRSLNLGLWGLVWSQGR